MKRNKMIKAIMNFGGLAMFTTFLVLIGETFGMVAWWYAIGASFGFLVFALAD